MFEQDVIQRIVNVQWGDQRTVFGMDALFPSSLAGLTNTFRAYSPAGVLLFSRSDMNVAYCSALGPDNAMAYGGVSAPASPFNSGSSLVHRMDKDGAVLWSHVFATGVNYQGGTQRAPSAMSFDGEGNLVVAEINIDAAHAIHKFSPAGALLWTHSVSGHPGVSDIHCDGWGNVVYAAPFALDPGEFGVTVLTAGGGFKWGIEGAVIRACFDPSGNVWTLNSIGTVTKRNPAGGLLFSFVVSSADDIDTDSSGNLWVIARNIDSSVQQFDAVGASRATFSFSPIYVGIAAGGNGFTIFGGDHTGPLHFGSVIRSRRDGSQVWSATVPNPIGVQHGFNPRARRFQPSRPADQAP